MRLVGLGAIALLVACGSDTTDPAPQPSVPAAPPPGGSDPVLDPSPGGGGSGAGTGTPSGQQKDANAYAFWSVLGEPAWNVDQTITLEKRAASTTWALSFRWPGATEGGTIGLQTDALRPDGTTGDVAVFSIQSATGSDGESCTTFGGAGSGHVCRLALTLVDGHAYRLRIWRVDKKPEGQYWGGYVLDVTSNVETTIGTIAALSSRTGIGDVVSFAEYFGKDVGCDAVPGSKSLFGAPHVNADQIAPLSFTGQSRGACTGGTVASDPAGARIELGGPR